MAEYPYTEDTSTLTLQLTIDLWNTITPNNLLIRLLSLFKYILDESGTAEN